MITEVSYEQLINYKNYVLVDLRTPAEYLESSIPGAINVPIFSDEERVLIGTTYKNVGTEEAKIIGMKIVGSRLSDMYLEIKKVAEGKQLAFYCARGGLRSRVLAYTMGAIGLPILKLDYGYKGYRTFVLKKLEEICLEVRFVTLFGKTGTGKTNILKSLEEKGYDVLDLEGCANHRGSIMGAIGLGATRNQKQFENLVVDALMRRKSNIIFVEGESKRIGSVFVPNVLYDATRAGEMVYVEASLENRIANIREEYLGVEGNKNEVVEALVKLKKYISNEKMEGYLKAVEMGNFDFVIEKLMTEYYDLNYSSSDVSFEKIYVNDDVDRVCEELIGDFC